MGIGVNAVTELAAASRIAGYDKELQLRSSLDDIYGKSVGMYVGGKRPTVPDAIRMKVVEKADPDSNNITITMVDKLGGEGVYDNTLLIGTETRPVTRAFTIYRNIVRKAVTTPGYGPDDLDSNPYGLYEFWVEQLSNWNKEHYGRSIRQGILEQYGETLVHGRTAALHVRNFHPNMAVCGRSRRNMQVTYDPNVGNYTNNIVNDILASGGGSMNPIANQTLNQPNLSNLCHLALDLRINKLSLPLKGRKMGWVFTLGERQETYLGDPVWSQRNLGSLYTSITELPKEVMEWPGVIGSYKDFLMVCDVMQPTLIVDGTSAPFGLTAGYVDMGDDDHRQREELFTRDTCFILGQGAIIDWQAQKLRHVKQDDDYEIIKGHGTAKTEGITLPVWNRDTANAINYSSLVAICTLPDYV